MTDAPLPPVKSIVEQLAPIVRRRAEPVVNLSEMPEPDVQAFRTVYGYREDHPKKKRANEYFDRFRNHGWWIGCSCRRDGDRRPLLSLDERGFVRRMEKGDRLRHSGYCPFHRDHEDQKKYKGSYKRPEGPINFLVRGTFKETKPDDEKSPRVSRKSKRRPASNGLQKILWSLLSEARINELTRAELALTDEQLGISHYYLLQEVINRHVLRPAKGGHPAIGLSDVFCLDPDNFGQFARELRLGAWPEDFRPQGFLLGVVDGIEGRNLHFVGGKTITVKGDVAVFGEEGEEGYRPPYLALLSVAQETRTSKYIEPVRAYVHPVWRRNIWMPVDSEYERITVGCLRAAMRKCVEHGMAPHLSKPLFDMNPDQGDEDEVLIPDFILNVQGQSVRPPMPLLIETMGYLDDDYRQGKVRIHQRMQAAGLGQVIEFDAARRPSGADPGCPFDREFLQRLYRRIGIA